MNKDGGGRYGIRRERGCGRRRKRGRVMRRVNEQGVYTIHLWGLVEINQKRMTELRDIEIRVLCHHRVGRNSL